MDIRSSTSALKIRYGPSLKPWTAPRVVLLDPRDVPPAVQEEIARQLKGEAVGP